MNPIEARDWKGNYPHNPSMRTFQVGNKSHWIVDERIHYPVKKLSERILFEMP